MNITMESRGVLHSNESEMIVLGCMLNSSISLKIGCESLDESDFYRTEHRLIFQALKSGFKQGNPSDVHLTAEDLKRHEKLVAVGGVPYLITLAQYAGTSSNITEYCDELKKYSASRALLDLTRKIESSIAQAEDPLAVILGAQEEIRSIEKSRCARGRFQIRFIDEFEHNFLVVNPPKKGMLLEYHKDGKPTGFLPKGIVAMLVGAGGVGKTHFLSQLAISIATGTPFLNVFTTTDQCGPSNSGSVFLGLGENQYDDIHRVLFKAAKGLRKRSPDLLQDNILFQASRQIAPFSFCGQQAAFIEGGKPSVYFRELKLRLIDGAPQNGWSLIILDPVSRLLGADAEIDNAAATQFIALLEELTIDLPGNPTVLFAHHVNKSAIQSNGQQSQSAARGSSALTDGVRWQVNLSKYVDPGVPNKEGALLKMTKSNFTAIADEIKLKKDIEGYLEIDAPTVMPSMATKGSTKRFISKSYEEND